jgi:23S rRNA (adenine2503-C2)-methyltransferase
MDSATFGMTLEDFAAAQGRRPRTVRNAYRELLRGDAQPPHAPPSRLLSEGQLTKFCLPLLSAPSFESESVIITMRNYKGARWYTLCVSSQVGCRMACTFCETGRMGLLRNLTAADIVHQYIVARRLLASARPPGAIANIVFMGMGEPFDNFDAVVQALRVLSDPRGLAFPLSHITLSTVGRIDGLRRLAQLPADRFWHTLRLAISLVAPTDALRSSLAPINRSTPLASLQRALREYPLPPRSRYMIEYVLLAGINDCLEHADAVADWCTPLPCVVNLIPYNPQRDATYETPSEETVARFFAHLRSRGIFVKRRLTHGRDLMGACGQLGNGALRVAEARLRGGRHAGFLEQNGKQEQETENRK